MPYYFLNQIIFASSEESDPFADLKKIGEKIIPNDPIAIVVQLLATFLLVLILYKFLVKPVRKYLKKRHDFIQGNLDEATTKNEEANKLLEEANTYLKDAKVTSKEMIENAKVTALNEKDRIVNDTKNEVEAMKSKARMDIDRERNEMETKLHDEVVSIAIAAASKVVEREVTDDDNEKYIQSFVKDNK